MKRILGLNTLIILLSFLHINQVYESNHVVNYFGSFSGDRKTASIEMSCTQAANVFIRPSNARNGFSIEFLESVKVSRFESGYQVIGDRFSWFKTKFKDIIEKYVGTPFEIQSLYMRGTLSEYKQALRNMSVDSMPWVYTKGTIKEFVVPYSRNLSNYSKIAKMDFYKKFLSVFKLSEDINKKFVELLNFSLKENILLESEVREILRTNDYPGQRYKLVWNGAVDPQEPRVIIVDLFSKDLPSINGQKAALAKRLFNTENPIFEGLDFHGTIWSKLDRAFQSRVSLSDGERDIFMSYLNHLRSLPAKKREQSLDEVIEHGIDIFKFDRRPTQLGNWYKKSMIKKFYKSDDASNRYAARRLKELKRQGVPDEEAIKEARQAKRIHEQLQSSCRLGGKNNAYNAKVAGQVASKSTGEMTEEMTQRMSRKTTNFFVGFGLFSSGGAYAVNNWDKEKDGRWYGLLGYDMAASIVSNFFLAKIIAGPGGNFMQKYFKNSAAWATSGGASSVLWGELFGLGDEAVEARAKTLGRDQNCGAARKLRQYMEDNQIWTKYEEIFRRAVYKRKLVNNWEEENDDEFYHQGTDIPSMEDVLGTAPINILRPITDDEWNNLEQQDFNTPEIREALMEVLATQMYDEVPGAVKLGNASLDFWVSHRILDTYYAAEITAVSTYIYYNLCISQADSSQAMARAVAVYMVNKAVMDVLYYAQRNSWITPPQDSEEASGCQVRDH
jgi:hypothetical protein